MESGSLRVISGEAGGIPLKSTKGSNTRPTTDRMKETLFNIIQKEVPGSKVLDLFAGSGALGIEALSRGSVCGVFVDKNVRSIQVIQENLANTGLLDRGKVFQTDYITALRKLGENQEKFHIIFLDPPYDQKFLMDAIQRIKDCQLLEKGGLIVVEKSLQESVSIDGVECVRKKIMGHSEILFLKIAEGD
jgi:16S rRNA (guanine966-N2)-methyltransferase